MWGARTFGALLRATTLLGALGQVTCPAIARAAWPAIEAPPINDPASVSGDGSTVVAVGVQGPAWNRNTQLLSSSPSLFLWDTASDGSFYPPVWTPHPSWAEAGSSESHPWPYQMLPTGLSADGTTYYGAYVDGDMWDQDAPTKAARYSAETGLETFGEATGNWLARGELPMLLATGASANGEVIVGSHLIDGKSYAFRWSQPDGIANLVQGVASNISADGSTVIGYTADSSLYKWTVDEGVVILGKGVPPYVNWLIGGVTADGSRVVGADLFWSAQTGTRDLFDVLTNWYGLDPAARTQFLAADISDDGRVIVGESDLGSFIVQLPASGDADGNDVVDGADYVAWADHFLASNSKWQAGDFNGDGVTDGADYTIWADNFLKPIGSSGPLPTAHAVPEPAALSLAMIGLLCCGIFGRRQFDARD